MEFKQLCEDVKIFCSYRISVTPPREKGREKFHGRGYEPASGADSTESLELEFSPRKLTSLAELDQTEILVSSHWAG